MGKSHIGIIDYQAGNQTSVARALDALGLPHRITSDPEILSQTRGLIFPGVGAAGQAMGYLKEKGLDRLIIQLIEQGRPLLGICLGCQILLEYSQEDGRTAALGVLPGHCRRFDPGDRDEEGQPIRIPHMGWNSLRTVKPSPLFQGLSEEEQFYFVHSYYPEPRADLVLGQTHHGRDFASVFGRDGLWAVQFHPEKSGPAGLRLLRNFYEYCRQQF